MNLNGGNMNDIELKKCREDYKKRCSKRYNMIKKTKRILFSIFRICKYCNYYKYDWYSILDGKCHVKEKDINYGDAICCRYYKIKDDIM